jgi:hypothetical protein
LAVSARHREARTQAELEEYDIELERLQAWIYDTISNNDEDRAFDPKLPSDSGLDPNTG